ncbi:hypothetical protein V7S43_002257 [Phytophthora oleae]|uniref:Uncharacterized protein n=1 Tax=Phytophthora oleae TaxID=2107226 RepID=A0ABD3G4U1_9STRA
MHPRHFGFCYLSSKGAFRTTETHRQLAHTSLVKGKFRNEPSRLLGFAFPRTFCPSRSLKSSYSDVSPSTLTAMNSSIHHVPPKLDPTVPNSDRDRLHQSYFKFFFSENGGQLKFSQHRIMAGNGRDVALPPTQCIMSLLGLESLSVAEELRFMVGGRFRTPQQIQLADILGAMQSTSTLVNVTSWFSHQFDPTDDVEHYLQDLIRMHHYISAHNRQRPLRSSHLGNTSEASGAAVTGQLLHFYASFADSRDRHLLTKIYQTLGLSRAVTYCIVANTMPFKFQKEFLDLFAEDLPELREWINWLDELDHATSRNEDEIDGQVVYGPGYESAVSFVSRAIREHCMLTWLQLLRPLDTPKRLELIEAIQKFLAASNNSGYLSSTTSTLKKLGRFYETTGISAVKLLDLDVAVRLELALLLEEFPTIILITLFAKFNSEKMIHLVVKRGLPFFPKNDLLRMLEALAPAEASATEVFVATLFQFGRKKVDFLLLFLSFSSQSQLRLLDLMVATSNSPLNTGLSGLEEEDPEDAFASQNHLRGNYFLLKFFLFSRLSSPDLVIQKLSTLPTEMAQQVMYGVEIHSAEDLVVLGRGLEIVELPCLQPFLRLFLVIQLDWREALVMLVEEMSGEETLPLYDTLLNLQSNFTTSNKVTTVLQMLGGLDKKDKMILCRDILVSRSDAQDGDPSPLSSTEIHAKVLLYLCECELARHKVLRLLRAIPFLEYEHLLFFLRTQRMPEQVALTRLMLSMPSDANCRLLAKMTAWQTEALDSFFQVLLMLAKVEYKMFAKLVGSRYVSAEQLENFITVAVDMMNQASSRELVIFAAELPVEVRNLLFEMLADRPEKGVLLRIISYSTRVPPELMHILVALFHRMTWEIRSSFIEQLRALEAVSDVQSLAEVASNLQENEALRLMVLLFNPLQIPIRISLVALFLQISVHERALVLSRLVKMPKSSVSSFCTAMCNPNCEAVSPSFCRVIGLIDTKYHVPLLRLLKSEPLWFFLRLMAEYCEAEKSLEETTELLNRVADVVCLFTLQEHFLVLRDVIREALGDALPLGDIVGVLALFPDVPRLVEFLRYVMGFAKYARTTLIFRVLSKYQQPAFIFEMCRVLDLDDAVFALKRLDRLWQHRHEELNVAMEPLARLYVNLFVFTLPSSANGSFFLWTGFLGAALKSRTISATSSWALEDFQPRLTMIKQTDL